MKILITAAAILTSGAARAAEPLPPVGKWAVGYEERLCTLSRDFGTAATPTTLIIRPHLSGDEEQIALLMPGGPDRATRRGKGRIVIGPSGESFAMNYASGPVGKTTQRGMSLDVVNVGVRPRLLGATTLTVEADREAPTTFTLQGVAGALRALKACEDDLLRQWGADPAAMTTASPPQIAAQWFPRSEYPGGALASGASGHVIAIATVDPAGRVTNCRIGASAGNTDLDSGTCSILRRRGRFLPASEGAPTARYAVVSVNWRLEG